MMTKLTLLLCLLCVCTISRAQTKVRQKIDFNMDWQFTLGDDQNYCKADFDDSAWRTLTLPHDWSIEGEFSKEHSGRNAWLPGGIGWYRKSFTLDKSQEGKHIEIQFDGIYKEAKIWLNNKPVGVQHDGYTSFYYDISELVSFEKENQLVVRVDNSVQPNCRWYSGSGIYRNVWLTIAYPLHVKTWGTYVTTPSITSESAVVHIETSIENMERKGEFEMQTVILSPKGKQVTQYQSKQTIGNYQTQSFTNKLSVKKPEYWSIDTPQLYTAVTTLKSNGQIVDEYKTRFGIRSLQFDAKKGFFLNGENMKMKGVCLHHEAGILGAAVPKEIWASRLEKLKEIGCNAIRTAHNPPSVEFLDLCDEMGFLVMDEFVDKWDNASNDNPFFDTPFADPHFATEWKKNFGETIRRDRNHPSVIIWSVGNENHSPGGADQNQGLRSYGSFVRSLDPSRPVISGMERGRDCPVQEKVDAIIESCEYMDLIALNYGEQWVKKIYENNPGKPYVSTESYTYFNSALEKRFANIERSPWLDVMDNPQNMGLFLWVGFEYLGEMKKYPKINGSSGLFDTAGFSKSKTHLYKTFWNEEPHVHLAVYEGDADDFSTSGRWASPPMDQNWNRTIGEVVDMVTYSNCEEVELFLNGKSLGKQNMSDVPNFIMKWRKVAYKPGKLVAVAYNKGKEVTRSEIRTVGAPKRFETIVNQKAIELNQVIPVEVYITDSKNNRIVNAEQEITFSIEGDGEIIALWNGDPNNHFDKTNLTSHKSYKGRCLCIVKTVTKTGSFTLKVNGNKMKEQKHVFQSK